MGNICRSPTAEGCFRQHVNQAGVANLFSIDSAGTIAAHCGESADSRAQDAARSNGVDLGNICARQISANDFYEFDYMLAMDSANLTHLTKMRTENAEAKLSLLLPWSDDLQNSDVPDPYYGGVSGFEQVFHMINISTLALFEKLSV